MSQEKLIQLVYVSRASRKYSEDDLSRLTVHAQRRNVRNGITGLLFYSSGFFTQLIEGKPDKIQGLFNLICEDQWHTDVRRLVTQPVPTRSFPNWDMHLINFQQMENIGEEKIPPTEARLTDKSNYSNQAFDLLCEFLVPRRSNTIRLQSFDLAAKVQ